MTEEHSQSMDGSENQEFLEHSLADRPGGDSFYRPAGVQRRGHGQGNGSGAPSDGPRQGQRIAHFTLRRFIAKGGMGQVWEAFDEELRRAVALKLVLPDRVDARSLALFAREAHAGGRLAHPSIVTTLGHGTDGGRAWIAQELVEGSWTLKDFLDELRAADAVPKGYYARVAGLMAQLADALHAAHQALVIHRDVKPQNILIAPDETPKLTDFGLARVTDDSFLSITGEFAGTYAYMSPEQVTAKRIGLDHRTDIFSLGIVLYELLSLRRPFEGDTTHQISQKILFLDPPEPSKIRSQCPRELSIICGKAIEKDPDRRYQTMADFAADLRRHLANEPIHARPPGPVTRAIKWSKRNPAISSSGAVALLALAVVSSLLVVQARTAAALARSNIDLAAQTELAELRAEETAEQARIAEENAQQAEANAAEAEAHAESARLAQRDAEQRSADVLSLSAQKDLDDLIARAATLWPPHPEMLPRYERWLSEAKVLLEGRRANEDRDIKARPSLADHRAKLAELRSRSIPETDPDRLSAARSHARYAELETLRAEGSEPTAKEKPGPQNRETELLALQIEVGERIFADPEDGWWYRQLSGLVAGIEALHDPETGLAGDTLAEAFGWGVGRRQSFADQLTERTVEGEEARRLWAEAISAIESSPHYGGLALTPQMGLLPIGMDPDSGLWEFAHLMSGDVAHRGEDGKAPLDRGDGHRAGADPWRNLLDGRAKQAGRAEPRPAGPERREPGTRGGTLALLPLEVRDDAGSVEAGV
jgi:serine/threonine protein kinase